MSSLRNWIRCELIIIVAIGLSDCIQANAQALSPAAPKKVTAAVSAAYVEKILSGKRHPQLTTDWCWAASAETVMHAIDHDVLQCKQANHAFPSIVPPIDCCKTPTANGCINPAWPDFNYFGFNASSRNGPLSFDQVVDQIGKKQKPFAFTWNWDGGGAHMMVAVGYKIVSGQNLLVIFDPLPPGQGETKIITYDEYVGVPGDHTHSRDYFDVALLGH